MVANWKMHPPEVAAAKSLLLSIKKVASGLPHVQTVVCPPFPLISTFSALLRLQRKVSLGAQNIFHENAGAFTGEVSPLLVRDSGAMYAIVGHSERRAMGETDEIVAKKARAALHAGLKVILCVGETARDPDGDYLGHIRKQVRASLALVERKDLNRVLIAYEPVWAIGGTHAVAGHDIHQAVIFLKKVLGEIYSNEVAREILVLYGGSVTPENVTDILKHGAVDGLLVGGDSLDIKLFGPILRAAETVW